MNKEGHHRPEYLEEAATTAEASLAPRGSLQCRLLFSKV